jgi:hypothetical protein
LGHFGKFKKFELSKDDLREGAIVHFTVRKIKTGVLLVPLHQMFMLPLVNVIEKYKIELHDFYATFIETVGFEVVEAKSKETGISLQNSGNRLQFVSYYV